MINESEDFANNRTKLNNDFSIKNIRRNK
jgi:hypothetical protein